MLMCGGKYLEERNSLRGVNTFLYPQQSGKRALFSVPRKWNSLLGISEEDTRLFAGSILFHIVWEWQWSLNISVGLIWVMISQELNRDYFWNGEK